MYKKYLVVGALCLCIVAFILYKNKITVKPTTALYPLIIDHDGAVDDIISITLQIIHAPNNVKAITIVPADCYAKPTAWNVMQLQKLLLPAALPIPIGVSTNEGVHPFPSAWREHSWKLARIPLWNNEESLNNFSLDNIPSALDVLTHTIQTSATPINILETGPCTNIAELLHHHPEFKHKIHRIFIMGGAIHVKGNVEEQGHDGSAEWNIYNNPQAFHDVLRSGIPTTLIPLDATQFALIRNELITNLKKNIDIAACQLVCEGLQIVAPTADSQAYQLWDTLTSTAIINPDVITTTKLKINVILNGPSMGKTFEDEHGFEVDVALSANQELFEQTVLNILKKTK